MEKDTYSTRTKWLEDLSMEKLHVKDAKLHPKTDTMPKGTKNQARIVKRAHKMIQKNHAS